MKDNTLKLHGFWSSLKPELLIIYLILFINKKEEYSFDVLFLYLLYDVEDDSNDNVNT